jgi:hypothetical protein
LLVVHKREQGRTYWEEKIYNVHQAQNHVSDFRLMVTVTCEYQHRRDDVVGEHLPVVLPSLLDIDHQYLLQPEGILNKNVPL